WRTARIFSGSWGNPALSIMATTALTRGAAKEVPFKHARIWGLEHPTPGATRSSCGPNDEYAAFPPEPASKAPTAIVLGRSAGQAMPNAPVFPAAATRTTPSDQA